MSRRPKGEAVIERLLESGGLHSVRGAPTDGSALQAKAERTLATAVAVRDDPDSTCTLAYDAARFAGTALLAHQGLRPTTAGGRYAECAARGRLPVSRSSASCEWLPAGAV